MEKEDPYIEELVGKKIPILTLDNKWHQIFGHIDKSGKIVALEEKLNEMVKYQSKLSGDIKDIQKVKKKLMEEIVAAMNETTSKKSDKIAEERKRLIEECNDKIEDYQEQLLELPRDIDEVNKELMMETMRICYHLLKDNTDQIEEISRWITKTRIELKKNLIRKQEDQIQNHNIYSYLHDIFGADVLNIFDKKYDPDKRMKKRMAKTEVDALREQRDKSALKKKEEHGKSSEKKIVVRENDNKK